MDSWQQGMSLLLSYHITLRNTYHHLTSSMTNMANNIVSDAATNDGKFFSCVSGQSNCGNHGRHQIIPFMGSIYQAYIDRNKAPFHAAERSAQAFSEALRLFLDNMSKLNTELDVSLSRTQPYGIVSPPRELCKHALTGGTFCRCYSCTVARHHTEQYSMMKNDEEIQYHNTLSQFKAYLFLRRWRSVQTVANVRSLAGQRQ